MNKAEKEKIDHFFSIQSKSTQKNAKVVSREEIGVPLLHIDKNTPKVFIPCMPKSAADSENTTTSRITVAPTIVGCCKGYSRVEMDFLDGPNKWLPGDPYRAGYEICTFDYEYALEPNEKLVFDAPRTKEHWLVTYSKETQTYKPKKIGKMFFTEILFVAAEPGMKDQMPGARLKGYLWHECEEPIAFKEGQVLPAGYYEIHMYFEQPNENSKEDSNNHNALPISKAIYDENKKTYAAMLAEKVLPPIKQAKPQSYASW